MLSFEALGCADADPGLIPDFAKAAQRARTSGDTAAVQLLEDLAGVVRRTAALPAGVDAFGAFVAEQEGAQAAARRMGAYQLDPLLGAARDMAGPFAQQRQSELNDLLSRAQAAVAARQESSPIGSMLRALVRQGLNGATRKVIWSQTSATSDFAEHALTSDPEIGARVARRVSRNMLTFMDALAFREIGALPRSELAMTKNLLVVSPRRLQALALLTQPWLPEHVVLIADERTLAGLGRDAAQLASFAAFNAYAVRLKAVSACALAEAQRIRGRALDLSVMEPPNDVDFPEVRVVDLASRRAPGEKVLRIVTEDGRTILARPKTRLILYDPDGAVPTFASCNADELARGDRLCVIDETFVDMARARLDIRAAAAEEIRDYHERVQTQFELLDGESHSAKLRTLIRKMGDPRVLEATARTWTKLETETEKPLDLVLPRAPQEWSTFERFTGALGMPRPLAEYYWAWAVILTRKQRIRAALRLHEAYLAILVEPFTAEHLSPARRADIQSLRATAVGYVSEIVEAGVEATTPR